MFELYGYQQEANKAIWNDLQMGRNALLQAPTGAGKSILVADITKKVVSFGGRVWIIVDREILVTQLAESVARYMPEFAHSIGVACASTGIKKDVSKRITIGSRQTLHGMLNEAEPVQLVILDEAHLARPPRIDGKPDQYQKIINTLQSYNDRMRIFGCSATPYRLNSGFIYGNAHHPDEIPYFDALSHKITFKELTDLGYLSPLRAQIAENTVDLSNVSLIAGEYNLGELSATMGLHIETIKEAVDLYASDRKKIMIFCVDIEHAKKVSDMLGGSAIEYHSKMKKADRKRALKDFKKPQYRYIVSVATLTTGFDYPGVDCVFLARPTKSPGLLIQMIGRGLRVIEGKEDCLLIDIVGNVPDHLQENSLDKVYVKIPAGAGSGPGEMPMKICPGMIPETKEQCLAELHPSVCFCPECGHEFKKEVAEQLPNFKQVSFDQAPVDDTISYYQVTGCEAQVHKNTSKGTALLRITLFATDELTGFETSVTVWVCFEDHYKGKAVSIGMSRWYEFCPGVKFPDSVELGLWFFNDSHRIPTRVKVDTKGKYPEVKKLYFDEVEKNEPEQDEFYPPF